MKDELFNQLLESTEEMDEIIRGERQPSRVTHVSTAAPVVTDEIHASDENPD